MTHVVEVRLRLHLDEAEMGRGDTPSLAAERLVCDRLSLSPEEKLTLQLSELVR